MIIVPHLRRLRERRLLSQEELAAKAGLSRPTVSRIERGMDARPATIRRLAKALRVPPTDLIDEEAPHGR
jgi:transcriptional regulator with XRE-family HTH domain